MKIEVKITAIFLLPKVEKAKQSMEDNILLCNKHHKLKM